MYRSTGTQYNASINTDNNGMVSIAYGDGDYGRYAL